MEPRPRRDPGHRRHRHHAQRSRDEPRVTDGAALPHQSATATVLIAQGRQPLCIADHLVLSDRPTMDGPVSDARVVILGGGLTGISTAYHLKRPWLLFERDDRLGGHARTDQ